ncbi:MAG: S41 family peptidase [Paludibacter sp.]|nr:S41 family peptidase [Paludibacter sp.]MDD4198052.1 S41 family peptidase [Paludibacter sp.]MDD4427027.1 S41 family peptidase [Paludibacter sp.]
MLKKYCLILIFLLTGFSGAVFSQQTTKTFRISKSLSIFNSVLRELDMYYVDTLDHDKMVKSAVDQMLRNLDPYTVYIPETASDDITFMTTGEYGGIGAIITKTTDGICISEPYEGMPAQKNGLKAGDIILEIDGEKTSDFSVADASAKLKGTPNTEIRLKIKRYGEKKTLEKKFPREKIQIHPIPFSNIAAPKIGYILLNDFTEQAAMEVKSTIQEMINQHQIESLILDVRNNGGGLIDEAVKIMGYFVPKGTEIVSTKGKNSQASYTYKTTLEPIFPDMKIVVLVNSASASASEILAGAIQDLDRGVVIGERTFGKGLVQNIRPVSYGGHVKVTTAKYYIPSGRCIQAIDYAQRNEDGSLKRVPDSLTNEFKTKNGRIVRDGGGIIPDSVTQEERKINIAYYIYAQNLYFDYATRYAAQHETISNPAEFKLTNADFDDFVGFLKEKKFTYTPQTKKYFDDLYEFSKLEGFDKEAEDEFEALRTKLLPDFNKKLDENKEEILDFLSAEIIKRYYYQKGVIEYSLVNDIDLETAIDILNKKEIYHSLLQRGIK